MTSNYASGHSESLRYRIPKLCTKIHVLLD